MQEWSISVNKYYTVPPQYQFLYTFSFVNRYIPMLLKLHPPTASSATEYPLSAVMRLLSSPLCKASVGSVIMDLVENILDFHSATTRQDMQTESDNENELIVPVGDVVTVDDSGECAVHIVVVLASCRTCMLYLIAEHYDHKYDHFTCFNIYNYGRNVWSSCLRFVQTTAHSTIVHMR